MNLKRCENGHFYNGSKFMECPHCASVKGNMDVTASYADMGNSYNMEEEPATVAMSGVMQESVTVPITPIPESVTVPLSSAMPQENVSLKEAVSKAITAPTGVLDEEKTVSLYQKQAGIDPVAGWLVCIEGKDYGASFTIKSGRNFVGRAEDMDIVLHGDNSISREKHALILYEPRRREFIAQAGESRELFYLNDEVVLNPVRLKQYDILALGNTRLMFFPCCGEHFSWDDYKQDKEEEGKRL